MDPFDAQEAKPYKNDSQVLAMTNLVAAYQSNNIAEFERILATNKCARFLISLPALHNEPDMEATAASSVSRNFQSGQLEQCRPCLSIISSAEPTTSQ